MSRQSVVAGLALAGILVACGAGKKAPSEPGAGGDPAEHAAEMKQAEALVPPAGEKDKDAPDMEFLQDMANRSARQASKCDVPANTGPRGVAKVDVTFEPAGHSSEVVVHPPHEGTPIGACIRRAFERVIVTNFKGAPVVVRQTVDFAKKAK